MLAELTRIKLLWKGGILTILPAENQNLKNDGNQLRQEVRSTYLARKLPKKSQETAYKPQKQTRASIVAIYTPATIKPSDWTIVANKKGQKNYHKKRIYATSLKECGS
ncbi:hypothetical protein Golomagni_02024 [Golovinomyces magnicellulatus]|nr:hypothetical protein Golomagni_02024 [Golovinomyces magnicellulatus]